MLTTSRNSASRSYSPYVDRADLGCTRPRSSRHSSVHRQGWRLPYGFEVVGYAEEEGQRYKATFLGSGALTGSFDAGWLEQIDVRRLLMAHALTPLAGNLPLVEALSKHASAVFGEPIEGSGTPLYTDVRLFCEAGIPGVIYGAGPRTVLESHAKRADERLELEDLRRATKVIARALHDLLA